MIAGETEYIIQQHGGDNYDYFLKKLFGKNKAKKPKDKEAAKARRKEFWNKAGRQIRDQGGVAGIGTTIDNILGYFKGGGEPADYEINVGGEAYQEDAPAQQSKGIPTEVKIIGGVVVIAAIAWGFSAYKKNQAIKTAQIH